MGSVRSFADGNAGRFSSASDAAGDRDISG
jgi:hypothetical protein